MPRETEHLKLGTTYFRVGRGLHGNFLGTLSRVHAGIAEAQTCASRAHRLSEMALQEIFGVLSRRRSISHARSGLLE